MLRLISAAYPLNCVPGLRPGETTTSASHLEAQIEAPSVIQLSEVYEIFEQSTSQEAEKGRRKSPEDTSRRVQAEVDLIPSISSEVTVVDFENSMSTGSYVKVHPKGVNMTGIRNLLSGEDGMRSACSGKVEIVSQRYLGNSHFE
jgi:predicted amino acid racemase